MARYDGVRYGKSFAVINTFFELCPVPQGCRLRVSRGPTKPMLPMFTHRRDPEDLEARFKKGYYSGHTP
jgi:hypothetical protein